MKQIYNNIFKYTLCFILALGLVFTVNISSSIASVDKSQNKKAVVLILDMISLEELLESDTPNIDSLLENGSIGLMNTRSRSRISNKSSAYLSLGMGVKTLASADGSLAFNRDNLYPISEYKSFKEDVPASDIYKLYTGNVAPDGEIINIAFGDVEKTALGITPNNEVGLLGKVARENELVVGLLGNSDSDSPSREASLLAMDERGVVPFGSVGSDLLTTDASVLGGLKLDQDKLSAELNRVLPNVDMLFVDYGDPARIEKSDNFATDTIKKNQKIKAIERADSFLAKVIEKVDLDSTLFMIVTPNPSKETIDKGNFALTPFIMSSNATKKGLLTSNTTRQEGLVTNFDFAPTLFDFFDIESTDHFIGDSMKSINSENTTDVLLGNQEQFLYLRSYRSVFHWSFIALALVTLVGLYISKFTKYRTLPSKTLSYLGLSVISTPLTMMVISILGYKSIIFDIIFVIGGAFLIAYLLSKIFKQNLKVVALISLATSVFLVIDVYFIEKLMIISPLGSDAIAGGRFYGIGNDYMGILLGSTLLGIFSLFHVYKVRKHIIAIFTTIYMLLIVVALSPFFGANVGGTLSAMFVTIIALLSVLDKKFSLKKILAVGIGVFITIILFAALDMSFNSNPTHAGKALEALMTDGLSKFIEIVSIKLGQVFWNLIHASWNIVLFLQIILTFLLYKFKREALLKVRENYSRLFKGFFVTLLGGVVIFLFNDTGTIATSLILLYLFIPLGMLMNDID